MVQSMEIDTFDRDLIINEVNNLLAIGHRKEEADLIREGIQGCIQEFIRPDWSRLASYTLDECINEFLLYAGE